jgi:hypothetical protein
MTQKVFIDYGVTLYPAPAPAISLGSSFMGFLFPTWKGATQAFLDKTLNAALSSHERFRAIGDMVMFNISRNPSLAAQTPAFGDIGRVEENDLGFWIPVLDYGPDPQKQLVKAFGMMPAYLLVDRSAAVAAGREVWGMPKLYANFSLPENRFSSKGPFSGTIYGLDTTGADLLGSEIPAFFLESENIASIPIYKGGKRIDGSLLLNTFAKLKSSAKGYLWQQLLQKILDLDLQVSPQCFMLKQFRAADSAEFACYQEVIAAQLMPTHGIKSIKEMYIDTGTWHLNLPSLASLPFATDLGLVFPDGSEISGAATGMQTNVCIRMKLDYTITTGSPIT